VGITEVTRPRETVLGTHQEGGLTEEKIYLEIGTKEKGKNGILSKTAFGTHV